MESPRFPGPRPLWLVLLSLGLAGCPAEDQARTPCERLCARQADCQAVCEFEDEPGCDPDLLRAQEYSRCLGECQPAQDARGSDCEDAVVARAWCLEHHACFKDDQGDCVSSAMRYHEVCLEQPGTWVCRHFCTELALGCTPWERFGARGEGCLEACEAGAAQAACREAHYDLEACTPGLYYGCDLLADNACVPEADALLQACQHWAPATPSAAEAQFCAPVAAKLCACGIHAAGEDCVPLAENRCRFELGFGQPCRAALQAFSDCLAALPSCTRDDARDSCLPQWEQWSSACSPPH